MVRPDPSPTARDRAATPLPTSWRECRRRGWDDLDILLVSGDAYIDHPSFGVALIGRLLTSKGYRVAVLAQPRFTTSEDFRQFPSPRLFCGITAGNLDSIVANYSGNGKVRDRDAYSPDGNPWRGEQQGRSERRRPDRATLVYTALARSAFPQSPIVLGGIEASLRRFVHYDCKQDKLRSSFLTEAKADLLVYGMGERAVVEIARRCRTGDSLNGIAGTCRRLTDREMADFRLTTAGGPDSNLLILPGWEEIENDKRLFLEAEIAIDRHSRAQSPHLVIQRQQSQWLVQYPAAPPLSPAELDALYTLPFSRRPQPDTAAIPALTMIRDSVTIVRGCPGNCSFCSITRHQGATVVSRSPESILRECEEIATNPEFGGTISDLGGPTANLYGSHCAIGGCQKRDCLYPRPCTNLLLDEEIFLSLLARVEAVAGVKRVFISSGLRMALLLETPRLLTAIIRRHTPGALKIAPEHSDDELLRIMHKEPHALLVDFVDRVREIGRQAGLPRVELTPYLITAHPGSTPASAERLCRDMHRLGLQIRALQDFTPTPGTLATAMYVTGLRVDNRQPLPVTRGHAGRMREREILTKLLPPGNTAGTRKGPVREKSRVVRKNRRGRN
jgi:uncharacterized radical SAM protein YgiQ